jgi:hypothetical protein
MLMAKGLIPLCTKISAHFLIFSPDVPFEAQKSRCCIGWHGCHGLIMRRKVEIIGKVEKKYLRNDFRELLGLEACGWLTAKGTMTGGQFFVRE